MTKKVTKNIRKGDQKLTERVPENEKTFAALLLSRRICILPTEKTRASLLRPPKTTKMAQMAGVTQAKAWFRKKPGLFFLDKVYPPLAVGLRFAFGYVVCNSQLASDCGCNHTRLVIFFSLTEAPLTDPTPTPPNTPETNPKRTRNRPETEPNGAKRSRTEPNGAKRSQTEPKWTEIKPSRVGRTGGFVRMGGAGGCKGKRISLHQVKIRHFPLEPFFEISPGILCSGIDTQ